MWIFFAAHEILCFGKMPSTYLSIDVNVKQRNKQAMAHQSFIHEMYMYVCQQRSAQQLQISSDEVEIVICGINGCIYLLLGSWCERFRIMDSIFEMIKVTFCWVSEFETQLCITTFTSRWSFSWLRKMKSLSLLWFSIAVWLIHPTRWIFILLNGRVASRIINR